MLMLTQNKADLIFWKRTSLENVDPGEDSLLTVPYHTSGGGFVTKDFSVEKIKNIHNIK